MALTSKHSLPYPEPTADLRLGAGDIQALAQALDDRLGGALVSADLGVEAVANNTDDLLTLTVDDAETSNALFEQAGANTIEYVGTPTVIATVYAQVTWAGNGAGSRRLRVLKNGNVQGTIRQAPDADPLTMILTWPVKLATGDTLTLEAWQNSGGALNVTAAKFRCVIAGVSPA